MNIKKLLTLAMLVVGLGSSLSINTMYRQCRGYQCPRQQGQPQQGQGHHGHPHHQEHPHHRHMHSPEWKEVAGNLNVIEAKENDTWVQYQKSNKACPPMPHHHHWQGHQHGHEHRHGHGEHYGHHHMMRRVKYKYTEQGEKVDGVLLVKEKNGECWEYTRTSTQRKMTEAELEKILEESLQPD